MEIVAILPTLNINHLADGDLVVYEDRDVEFKHNSTKVHTNPRMIPHFKLHSSYVLQPMKYSVNNGAVKCYIVKKNTSTYRQMEHLDNLLPYGTKE